MSEREDDPTIRNGEPLWRRILPEWVTPTPEGGYRPSSAAFLDGYTGEVSVYLAKETNSNRVLADHSSDSLAELLAEVPRSLGHSVVRDPTPDEPAHTLICPPPGLPKKRRKSDARLMSEKARWIVLKPLLAEDGSESSVT